MDSTNPDVIRQLTELLAAHGVYFLTIVFLFYFLRRAAVNLRNAPPDERSYFKKVHLSVFVAGLTLAAFSTAIWFYATFVYQEERYIRGSVAGLAETAAPETPQDPARIVEQIAPESLDTELYVSKRTLGLTQGRYDVGWVLLPRDKVKRVTFRFEHHYEIMKAALSRPFDGRGDRALLELSLAEAVEQIEASRTRVPGDIHLSLALAFFGERDYERAARFFDLAGADGVANDEYYFYRGFAYAQTHQNDKAAADFRQYLAKPRSHFLEAVTYTNLGDVSGSAGRFDAAVEYYRKAIKTDPTVPDAYNNLAYLYAEREEHLDEALRLVTRALEMGSPSPAMLDTKGWVLFRQGKIDQALEQLEAAAEKAPSDPDIRKHLDAVRKARKTGAR